MSVPINIPSSKKDMYNRHRKNVGSRNLSFKKALLPKAFLQFRKIWNEYFFPLFLLFISLYMKGNIRKVYMDRTTSIILPAEKL